MKRLHYLITTLLAVAVLLAACGGQPTAEEVSELTSAPDANAATEVAAPTNGSGIEQASGDCEEGFRLFDHELLATEPVCVPEEPQRVAMLETIGTELMFTLDMQPVVQPQSYTDQLLGNFPEMEQQLTNFFGDIPGLSYAEPNLEIIAQGQPDLIVVYDVNLPFAEQLNEIAPTIFMKLLPEVDLALALEFEGTLLGLEEEVEALLTQYDERVAVVGEQVVPQIDDQSVVIARADGPPLSFFATSPAYTILQDAGWQPTAEFAATLTEIQTEFDYGIRPVSMEELTVLDGDYLFFYNLVAPGSEQQEAEERLDDTMASPLWHALSVVDKEQAHLVPSYWNFNGILSAHYIIDDLLTYVAEVDPAEVSPNPFLTKETDAETAEEITTAHPLTVTDAAGHKITLESAPETVMCMWNGCVSDMAFVGVIPDAVTEGVESLGGHPTHFGDNFDEVMLIPQEENLPNLEEILAIEPDLVIGNTDGYAATSPLVPSYEQNYETATLDLFFFDVRNYARMFGREEQTEARIARLLQRAEAYGIASGREKSIYLGFPNDDKGSSWSVNGGDATCGFVQPEGQCTADYNDEWQEVTVEGLLAIDPDVFIIEDHGGEYSEEPRAALTYLEDNPLWQELTAVQNEQIHLIPRAISRPGYPLTLELWLDEVMPLAYPDLFFEPLTDKEVQEILATQ